MPPMDSFDDDVNSPAYVSEFVRGLMTTRMTRERLRMTHLRLFSSMRVAPRDIVGLLEALESYVYASSIAHLIPGRIVRILTHGGSNQHESRSTVRLHAPCIFCEVVAGARHPLAAFKTIAAAPRPARFFTRSLAACVVFQKMTEGEALMLAAMEHARKMDREWVTDSEDGDSELTDSGDSSGAADEEDQEDEEDQDEEDQDEEDQDEEDQDEEDQDEEDQDEEDQDEEDQDEEDQDEEDQDEEDQDEEDQDEEDPDEYLVTVSSASSRTPMDQSWVQL